MRHLLTHYYDIFVDQAITVGDKAGFKKDEWFYFTISVDNREAILMEQTVLAYYLAENGYPQIALPIQNVDGEWVTNYGGNTFIVLSFPDRENRVALKHGEALAYFHQNNASYAYEPQAVSSYGQWKQLWIDKLIVFEERIEKEASEHPTDYYHLLMDVLPYVIGISENAIQYIQESEQEIRYDESDQGTITFHRYNEDLIKQIIWPNTIVYDHPTRDIAEYIRPKLLSEDEGRVNEAVIFMGEYLSIRKLSIFGWRLLYARLIYPIQLFDLIGDGFLAEDYNRHYESLTELLKKQSAYEKNVGIFFGKLKLNYKKLHIPMLQWT